MWRYIWEYSGAAIITAYNVFVAAKQRSTDGGQHQKAHAFALDASLVHRTLCLQPYDDESTSWMLEQDQH